MRGELQTVLAAVREMPAERLPELLGELEQVRCTAMARLTAPQPAAPALDELLDVAEAARRLGRSENYLYRNKAKYPFTVCDGTRVQFSARGIERYIRQKTGRNTA
jgi:hypothetical protein